MISKTQLSPHQAQMVIQSCFADLIDEAEVTGGYVPRTFEPDLERDEQIHLSKEAQANFREQLETLRFNGIVLSETEMALAKRHMELEALSSPSRLNLLSGIARALIERERWFRFRIGDRVASFTPVDPLFAKTETKGHAADPAPPPPSIGMSVAEAIGGYLKYGESCWVRKTLDARRWQLGFFVEHLGSETPLITVTPDHIRSFRDAVRALHKRHGKMRGVAFAAKQTTNVTHRISDKTAENTFDTVRSFFRWAKSVEGLIATNPAEDVRIISAKKPKGQKARRPFTAAELQILFSAPVFTGCQSRNRRYASGLHVIKDAKFWLPVLGYYTGARLGELVQLHVRDVQLDGDVPYLSIDEENAPDVADGDRKHVKSEAGVRLVPLHPDVIELGFAELVAQRASKKGKGRVRLFDEFPYGSDGQSSTVASKWFARFMDAIGLDDPALVFHSFRHNAEDAFRNSLVPQYVTDRIIGHADGSVSASYGDGASLDVLYEAVKGMKLPYRISKPSI